VSGEYGARRMECQVLYLYYSVIFAVANVRGRGRGGGGGDMCIRSMWDREESSQPATCTYPAEKSDERDGRRVTSDE
jgi:hypothetical protein